MRECRLDRECLTLCEDEKGVIAVGRGSKLQQLSQSWGLEEHSEGWRNDPLVDVCNERN